MQFVFGASALVYVVAAHNTNIETSFWATYLSAQRRWSTAAPTTGDMRYAQAQILLKVSPVQRPFVCPALTGTVLHLAEIPGTVGVTDRVARGCAHCGEERHLALVCAIS